MKDKFYLTTPIYYPNARPHVGSAYTTIVCDVLARYKRMCGYDVAFLTGTDEHGEKLQRAADAAGIPVEQFVAEKRELFKNLWQTLGIPQYSPENPAGYRFVHTSQNPDHVKSVHWMIRQARQYKIPYCARCEAYLKHSSSSTACPGCGGSVEFLPAIYSKKYEGRYCIFDERYVSDSSEPVNCDICGRPAELISEENYFFRLSAFQGRLEELYAQQIKDPQLTPLVRPDFRLNEVVSFVTQPGGLRDISISRKRLKWGIPWPDDPEQVVYVWYDALTSYLTGIGFAGERRSEDFEKHWPADVHMIGKDILRFHAVYWPAFLWAAGLELPKAIFAHGWIYYEQDKMSKSKGNVVYPEPIVDALNSFGAPGNDALRYYLLRDTPFGQDASFSYEALIQRYNSDLANDLGNLASRTIAMINRYCDGAVPKPAGDLTDSEKELKADFFGGPVPSGPTTNQQTTGNILSYAGNFDRYYLQPAVGRIWDLISTMNGYLVRRKPWKLAESGQRTDRATLDLVLYTAADLLRIIAVLLYPLIPESSNRLWRQLGCEDYLGKLEDQRIDQPKWGELRPGTKVGKPEPIFPRLDKAATLGKLYELAAADAGPKPSEKEKISVEASDKTVSSPQAPSQSGGAMPTAALAMAPASDKISIDDFAKVDLRVGQVVSAEPIPGATKLLKLQVDIGSEVRQVCAGIAEHYQPEQLIGKKVVIVANLQPRKLRGVESNGMVVAASVGEQGKPVLVTFTEEVPNGTRLK